MFREYGRWLPYITDIFLPICESEHGDLLHLPFPGSLMDQPYMTMQVVLLVQAAYKSALSEKIEKMRAKPNGSPAARRRGRK